ncbi:MAG: hypothetical protein AAF390_04240 [Pseudomonadota bacterium]
MPRPILLLAALALPGCTAVTVADTAVDAVVFTGTTAVRGAVGAGRLVTRGAAAGVRALSEPEDGYPAGTVVCLDDTGAIYAAAVEGPDGPTCPDPV